MSVLDMCLPRVVYSCPDVFFIETHSSGLDKVHECELQSVHDNPVKSVSTNIDILKRQD